MGERIWEPSPSPEETWSDASAGANEDGEWQIEIVGEEIRLDGTSRYEVKWMNWHRQDGSNTTWERGEFHPSSVNEWKRKQKRMCNIHAEESFDMLVPWPDDAVHKRLTDQRRQAFDEKLARRRMSPIRATDWDVEIQKEYSKLDEQETGGLNPKLRLRRTASVLGSPAGGPTTTPSNWNKLSSPASSIISSRDPSSAGLPSKRNRDRQRLNSIPNTAATSATLPPSAPPRKGKMPSTSASVGTSRDVEIVQNRLSTDVFSQPTLVGRISSAWNKAAKDAGAATIRISPDITDEDIPRNLRKFKYLERGYVFRASDGIQKVFDVPRGAFMSCDCISCLDTSGCTCRDLSKIYDMTDKMAFSTYIEGLFVFELPRGVEAVECNKYCRCNDDCGNRVVQRPRNVSLEIFDTHRCGWGVRALEDIPRGRVLGTYTGTLIPRGRVDDLSEDHHEYMFDLDSTEVKNSENPGEKYTVDCYECGNWTRFVNHSCSPNMGVYGAVYDTIPDVNMSYVAFAASTDITAGTELTIDYNPYAEEDKKGKRRASGRECRCLSSECRGWY